MNGRVAFVYGTLMAPEVVNALLKRVPPMRPAKIKGYIRYSVKGVVFPAIIKNSADSEVQGKVLLDLTQKELDVLDAYESIEYYRQAVTPILEDGSTLSADVYVWKDEFMFRLELVEWDYELWRSEHLETWVTRLSPCQAHP
ncbi:hypothetical protein CEUSTIGMA_g1410.t1 [Chlamydomonas eustigma]|uniref:Putative gamma-glutamylcyclotransferase n=1 Tax=Chlamydomonas eustigma TaxID=1157962 RepID=A0A250WTT9_9CHLO|nr:hypothetical protein CEUSTIGMA_g1410.t1 [Chlamydomonas eustigma]|eukprot:GAX73960.1 hypothetical protein CEUSTIGMA_g1410.t1 [Chlamydomonas eustigma]